MSKPKASRKPRREPAPERMCRRLCSVARCPRHPNHGRDSRMAGPVECGLGQFDRRHYVCRVPEEATSG